MIFICAFITACLIARVAWLRATEMTPKKRAKATRKIYEQREKKRTAKASGHSERPELAEQI